MPYWKTGQIPIGVGSSTRWVKICVDPIQSGMSTLVETLSRVSTAAYQAASTSEGFSDNGTAPEGEEGPEAAPEAEGGETPEGEETVEGEFKEV